MCIAVFKRTGLDYSACISDIRITTCFLMNIADYIVMNKGSIFGIL